MQDLCSLCLQTIIHKLLVLLFLHLPMCLWVFILCHHLVWWLDVYKALNEVGPLHFSQRGVERVLTLAGDDQTHEAGVNHHLIHYILQTCSHKETRGINIKARIITYTVCDYLWQDKLPQRSTNKKMSYSVQCAGAAVPQGPAHAQVRLVTLSHDPGHQEEQLKVASIPPAQKHPAASVSQCLLFCLNIIITSVNAWSINPISKWRECKQVFFTLQLSAVNHLHMCIQIISSFPAEGSGQSALSTALRGEKVTTLVKCTFQFLKKINVCLNLLYIVVMSRNTLAPVMSRAPPWRPCPVLQSSLERGLPKRLWEMNSNPVSISLSIPLGKNRGVRDIERNKCWKSQCLKPCKADEELHLPKNAAGGKLWVGCFSCSFHRQRGHWLSVYLWHKETFFCSHHIHDVICFVEIVKEYWWAEHNMCMVIPVCRLYGLECVLIKTAGLEDHSLVLVSAQLEQTLTLLYRTKKKKNRHIILTTILMMHCDFILLYMLYLVILPHNHLHIFQVYVCSNESPSVPWRRTVPDRGVRQAKGSWLWVCSQPRKAVWISSSPSWGWRGNVRDHTDIREKVHSILCSLKQMKRVGTWWCTPQL